MLLHMKGCKIKWGRQMSSISQYELNSIAFFELKNALTDTKGYKGECVAVGISNIAILDDSGNEIPANTKVKFVLSVDYEGGGLSIAAVKEVISVQAYSELEGPEVIGECAGGIRFGIFSPYYYLKPSDAGKAQQ